MGRRVLVSGIDLPVGVVALLALRLHKRGEVGLASRIGFAVDMNRAELRLNTQERRQLLDAVEDDPEFADLRVALGRE